MASTLVCRCGAPLVSDGDMWRCPLRGTVNAFGSGEFHKGDQEPDFRPKNIHQQPAPRVGKPGRFGSKRCHSHHRTRLHSGPMAGCGSCSGESRAQRYRQMVARLKARFSNR